MTQSELAALSEADAEFCNYCSDNCPPHGYWHCPVCDAEWPDDDTDTPAEALKGTGNVG